MLTFEGMESKIEAIVLAVPHLHNSLNWAFVEQFTAALQSTAQHAGHIWPAKASSPARRILVNSENVCI